MEVNSSSFDGELLKVNLKVKLLKLSYNVFSEALNSDEDKQSLSDESLKLTPEEKPCEKEKSLRTQKPREPETEDDFDTKSDTTGKLIITNFYPYLNVSSKLIYFSELRKPYSR
jgi:hypothetical protein